MTSSEGAPCFYCSEYAKVAEDYPINVATNEQDSFTPRCHLHWKYNCSTCVEMTHFNGISWCTDCRMFTCISCANEKMVREEFLVYDYYYAIPCSKCGKENPSLDYAEYSGTHPFQNGDLTPDPDVVLWSRTSEAVASEIPTSVSGTERILSMDRPIFFKRLDSLGEHSPKSSWDSIAPYWLTVEEENYHHKHIILPNVYRMLDAQKGEAILDVACGKGAAARHLARSGAVVTGIDISKMLDYAIEIEEEEKLGISYVRLNAEKLSDHFGESTFDRVVCNMALMDIHDFKATLKQVSLVLKDDGVFVFSILHPAFTFPATLGRRIPEDSKRNEDRVRIILDYFDDRPHVVDFGGWGRLPSPSLVLQFHRTISTYLNELVRNNLIFLEMCEPQVSEELVQMFPKNAYWEDQRRPEFLIIKAVKRLSI